MFVSSDNSVKLSACDLKEVQFLQEINKMGAAKLIYNKAKGKIPMSFTACTLESTENISTVVGTISGNMSKTIYHILWYKISKGETVFDLSLVIRKLDSYTMYI